MTRVAADPLRRPLRRRLSLGGEADLAATVPRLVERLRLHGGRRQRRDPRGRPDLRRLFRANLGCGGVPFVLPRRRVRPRRPRVVLLLDVSWSTRRAAGLFLSLAAGFLRRRRTTVLPFVDRCVDATAVLGAWLDGAARVGAAAGSTPRGTAPGAGTVRGRRSFLDALASIPALNLDAASDHGRAFHGLLRSGRRPGGRDTVLVVLGDGRNNRLDAQAWAFQELAGRCGAALWLVPEPLETWFVGDSALAEYLPHVDVAVEAADLDGLARGVAALLRRA